MRTPRPSPSLTRLIRQSPALDATARRHWLAVLPHLTPEDRERLRDILTADADAADMPIPDAQPAPSSPGGDSGGGSGESAP
jgi:hypothetical protein